MLVGIIKNNGKVLVAVYAKTLTDLFARIEHHYNRLDKEAKAGCVIVIRNKL